LFKVDGGHRAVIFDRFQGIKEEVIGEGTHFMIPWLHKPIIFDIRTRPRSVAVSTGSKGKLFSKNLYFSLYSNVYF
jgi:prohibitin 1